MDWEIFCGNGKADNYDYSLSCEPNMAPRVYRPTVDRNNRLTQ